MRITLAQIEAFVATARAGSVNAAARHLNLAQPTVSLRLRDLESALSTKLFERSGRGLQLSRDGLSLLGHADRVLHEIVRMKQPADDGHISGRVRLGVSESFAVTGLPALLRLVKHRHPLLQIELSIGSSPELVRETIEHNLDLAIAINPMEDMRLRPVPLGVQPATWAASPRLRLPSVIRPSDILHQTVLVNPSPSPNWRQTMSWFGTAGVEPRQISICNTVPSVISHLIEEGLGLAILPTRLIEPMLKSGTLVALGGRPDIERSILCAVRRAGDNDVSVDAVTSATRTVLEELGLLEPT